MKPISQRYYGGNFLFRRRDHVHTEDSLEQETASFFCKGAISKCFSLCRLICFCTFCFIYNPLPMWKQFFALWQNKTGYPSANTVPVTGNIVLTTFLVVIFLVSSKRSLYRSLNFFACEFSHKNKGRLNALVLVWVLY